MPPTRSLRPFVGARDFDLSRDFYRAFGFAETVIDPSMSLFQLPGGPAFYLQRAYVKDWVDNTMLFLEVEDVYAWQERVVALSLPQNFKGVRVSAISEEDWGREFFVHDPSGVLWHVGAFG